MKAASGTTKVALVFLILFFPSVFYLFLLQGKHNFVHLPRLTITDENGEESYRTIDDFRFIDQNNKAFTKKQVEGKIYVVDFFFTSCLSICPIMTENMKFIHGKFNTYKDFAIVSHTVDPKHDTPLVLKEYAMDRHVDFDNWFFVTGNRDSLYATAYQYLSSAMEDPTAPGGFLHTEYFVLVDKEGNIRCREDDNGNLIGVYDGTDRSQVKHLVDDIKVLMAEYQLELKKNNKQEDE